MSFIISVGDTMQVVYNWVLSKATIESVALKTML
jgi:hypothetical protein